MSRAPIPIISPTLEAYLRLAHYVVYIHMTIYPSAYCTRSSPEGTPAHEALAQVLYVSRLEYQSVDLLRYR